MDNILLTLSNILSMLLLLSVVSLISCEINADLRPKNTSLLLIEVEIVSVTVFQNSKLK